MQECAVMQLGTFTKQAQVISMQVEEKLWNTNVLGENTPDKLHNTVLYLVGVNCALRAGDEHYNLHRQGGCTTLQFSFELNEMGLKCLVYTEDSVTKTNKGGLKDMKKDRKIVWVKPNSDWRHCLVRLVEKYMSLLPKTGAKPNFYLQSLWCTKPYCWFSTIPVGINTLRKTVSTLLKDAGLDGFFTNHSLRRTCATRLFQTGADTKLVKEITGHISDAVHKYQKTSIHQKMEVSKIIQGDVKPIKLSEAAPMEIVESPKVVSLEDKCKLEKIELPIKLQETSETHQDGLCNEVNSVIHSAIEVVGDCKATVTIQVELNN